MVPSPRLDTSQCGRALRLSRFTLDRQVIQFLIGKLPLDQRKPAEFAPLALEWTSSL